MGIVEIMIAILATVSSALYIGAWLVGTVEHSAHMSALDMASARADRTANRAYRAHVASMASAPAVIGAPVTRTVERLPRGLTVRPLATPALIATVRPLASGPALTLPRNMSKRVKRAIARDRMRVYPTRAGMITRGSARHWPDHYLATGAREMHNHEIPIGRNGQRERGIPRGHIAALTLAA